MTELYLFCQGCRSESLSLAGGTPERLKIEAERSGWQVTPVALCPDCKRATEIEETTSEDSD